MLPNVWLTQSGSFHKSGLVVVDVLLELIRIVSSFIWPVPVFGLPAILIAVQPKMAINGPSPELDVFIMSWTRLELSIFKRKAVRKMDH